MNHSDELSVKQSRLRCAFLSMDNKEAMPEDETVIPSNNVLTSIYSITRAVFRHLPLRSVDSFSGVCQSWAHLARLLKQSRRAIHTLAYPSTRVPDQAHILANFDAFMSSFVNERLWSLPCLALVVSTNTLNDRGLEYPSSAPPATKSPKRSRCQATARCAERRELDQALLHHLNKSCQVLMVVSDGIIASNDEHQSNEIESGTPIPTQFDILSL